MDTLLFDSHLTTGGSGNGNKPNDPNDSDFADGADGGADEGAGGDSAGPPGPGEITGLPEDYDPRYIPTQRVMQMTAERELDDWIAFLLLHQDAPDIIVDQLENIASTIIAALNVPEPGEHLIKAVRLSLALKPEYWIAGDKAHIWSELFASLLPISINLHDGAYCSSAYRIWGIYRHLTHECPTKVLDVSEEYALDVKREDLALLARAERFDMQVTTLSLDEAEAKAESILADARRLNWPLIQGRVYYSLARAYQQATLPRSAFNYAQQALAFFFQQDVPWLAAVAINAMLGSIQLLDDHSVTYTKRLIDRLKVFAQQSINPWLPYLSYQQCAAFQIHSKNYDQARACVLRAYLIHRSTHGLVGRKYTILHRMGLVQKKRCRWYLAERYYDRAYQIARFNGEQVKAVHALNGLALIPYAQERFEDALRLLEDLVIRINEEITDDATREWLLQLIRMDIDDCQNQLGKQRA